MNKMNQNGGTFSIVDITNIRDKIIELKELSKDGIKECLSNLDLNIIGSKDVLEKRLLDYIIHGIQEDEEKSKAKTLDTEESETFSQFDEVTQETLSNLYKEFNYTEYCSKFKINYDLRRFVSGSHGSIDKVNKVCSYYFKKQSIYQNKVIELLTNGTREYEIAQDYFENIHSDKLTKTHIETTIKKYENALEYFNKFISYTNFSVTNYFTYELHKLIPNYDILNKLLRSLGSINVYSRRIKRVWTKQKIIEITAIIFTLQKQVQLLKGTKKKGVFSSLIKKHHIESYHNEILSGVALKYEDMFKDIEIWAKPTSVYDGDTLTVNILFPPKVDHFMDEDKVGQFITSLKVRCNGYDTPEMKGKTIIEKQCAMISKVAFMRKIKFIEKNSKENGLILLKLSGLDKYGRALGDVFVVEKNNKINVNQFMIDNQYGYPYSGSTKIIDDFLKLNHRKILDDKESLQFSKEENKMFDSIKIKS